MALFEIFEPMGISPSEARDTLDFLAVHGLVDYGTATGVFHLSAAGRELVAGVLDE